MRREPFRDGATPRSPCFDERCTSRHAESSQAIERQNENGADRKVHAVRPLITDRVGRARTLDGLAIVIAMFSGFAPTLMEGGKIGQDAFILIGFALLGLSYGQAAGAVTANFGRRYRYTGGTLGINRARNFKS